jgi:propanol-preferring alcohol dehydrogenase
MGVTAVKAMVLREPRPVEENPLTYVDLPKPEPAPGQVRLRVRACGVCHTDLHLVEGEIALPKLPVVPGHQIVGQVDAVGDCATRFHIGDRVGVPWL